jgi:hypothetical protein
MADQSGIDPEYGRAALSIAAFLIGAGGVFLLFGASWFGFFVMVIIVSAASAIRQMGFGLSSGRSEALPEPGVECPACGSLQTGYDHRFADDGTEFEQFHCFECDSDIDPDDLDAPTDD